MNLFFGKTYHLQKGGEPLYHNRMAVEASRRIRTRDNAAHVEDFLTRAGSKPHNLILTDDTWEALNRERIALRTKSEQEHWGHDTYMQEYDAMVDRYGQEPGEPYEADFEDPGPRRISDDTAVDAYRAELERRPWKKNRYATSPF